MREVRVLTDQDKILRARRVDAEVRQLTGRPLNGLKKSVIYDALSLHGNVGANLTRQGKVDLIDTFVRYASSKRYGASIMQSLSNAVTHEEVAHARQT